MPKCTFEKCTVVAKPSLIHIPLVSSIHQFVRIFPIEIQARYFSVPILNELKLWANTSHFWGQAAQILSNFCLICHCSGDYQTFLDLVSKGLFANNVFLISEKSKILISEKSKIPIPVFQSKCGKLEIPKASSEHYLNGLRRRSRRDKNSLSVKCTFIGNSQNFMS